MKYRIGFLILFIFGFRESFKILKYLFLYLFLSFCVDLISTQFLFASIFIFQFLCLCIFSKKLLCLTVDTFFLLVIFSSFFVGVFVCLCVDLFW